MDAPQTYLRLAGWISAAHVFSPLVGWETQLIKRCPKPNSPYRVRLVDAKRVTLVEVGAALDTPECRSLRVCGHNKKKLIAYAPMVSDASELQLLLEDRLLYRHVVSASPPTVTGFSVDAHDPRRVRVGWRVGSQHPTHSVVMLIDGERRPIRVGNDITDQTFEFDAISRSGGPNCRVAVIVSDGLRSTACRSELFSLPRQPPLVRILAPLEKETISPARPVSALGHATDLVGRPVDDANLAWRLDGRLINRGSRTATLEELAPGEHTLELECIDAHGERATAEVALRVRDCSKEEVEWSRASEAFAARDHGLSSFSVIANDTPRRGE